MKTIVITTINSPTEAIRRFCDMKDWNIIIVGDLKTPHSAYRNLSSNVRYIGPEEQHETYPELSKALGWNASCRRNIGFIEAYKSGSEIMAMTDDDNIPMDNWGKNIMVGKTMRARCYHSPKGIVFNPIWPTNVSLWHRGFPIEQIGEKNAYTWTTEEFKVLVQANFWNGDPDIDAMERILYRSPDVKFDPKDFPFTTTAYSPFNSQNTIIDRSIIPHYLLIPGIGRVDDIWGAYRLERNLGTATPFVLYAEPTVYQVRNEHDLYKDMEQEIFGMRNILNFLVHGMRILPPDARIASIAYMMEFKKMGVKYEY